jgi:hypothetical protein
MLPDQSKPKSHNHSTQEEGHDPIHDHSSQLNMI